MKRVFAAVDISDEARAKVSHYIENLRATFPQIRVGWEKAAKLHLTLKFFGNVNEAQLSKLIIAAEESAGRISDFRLQIAGTGIFPSKKNPRILWLGVQGEIETLQNLNAVLENECEKAGFEKEKRSFKAHLTIARLREPNKSAILANLHAESEFSAIDFAVRELIIYESHLNAFGSQYAPLFRARFLPPTFAEN